MSEATKETTNNTGQTGPKTEAGKAISRMNAYRHGMTGRTIIISAEEKPFFDRHTEAIFADWKPATATETELVRIISDGFWRLRHARSIEDAMFALRPETDLPHLAADALMFEKHVKAFNNLTLYEQRIQRQVDKATEELKTLQAECRKEEQAARQHALQKHRFNLMLLEAKAAGTAMPYESMPLESGDFVFSTEEMDRELALLLSSQKLETARKADFRTGDFLKKVA